MSLRLPSSPLLLFWDPTESRRTSAWAHWQNLNRVCWQLPSPSSLAALRRERSSWRIIVKIVLQPKLESDLLHQC